MALILNCRSVSKQFGARVLFRGRGSFTVEDGERFGLIGPNGSGRRRCCESSTETSTPNAGEVAPRKGVRISHVPRIRLFDPDLRVGDVLEASAREPALVAPVIGQAGFRDAQVRTGELSGGWRKRLSLARALVEQPDLLLLDEPTNHLDLEGILWLEKLLVGAPFATVVVTHDRYFLENVANHVAEINRVYPEGVFRWKATTAPFWRRREQYFAAQAKQQESLAVQGAARSGVAAARSQGAHSTSRRRVLGTPAR